MKTNPFRPLIRFASRHPIQSNALTSLLTLLSGLAANIEPLFWPCVVWFALLTALLCFLVSKDWKARLCVMLAALTIQPSAKAAEPPREFGLGAACIVVVVVGGVVVYQVNQFCKKHFSPPPDPSTNSSFYADGGETMAASSCAHYKANCSGGDDLNAFGEPEEQKIRVSISGRVVETPAGPEIQTITLTMRPASELLTEAEYRSRLAALGLPLQQNCGGCVSYGFNGRPATADQVPIRFSFDPEGAPMVRFETVEPTRLVTIQRSTDLVTWSSITTTRVPVGKVIVFGDDPDVGHAFYRMTATY